MSNKEQIAAEVADLRAKIDGKIRFTRAISGYNPTEVNSYIDDLKSLRDQENKEAQDAYSALEHNYQELEQKSNQLQETVNKREAELNRILAKAEVQEAQIIHLNEELTVWQKNHDPDTVHMLREENSKLSAALEMRICEYDSQKKQLQALGRQNIEFANQIAETDQRIAKFKQEERRKLSVLKSLEGNSLSELKMRLEGCLAFLTGLSEKSAEEWEKLIQD